jgi:hypothetical protein
MKCKNTNRREHDAFVKYHGPHLAEDHARAQHWWAICEMVEGLNAPRPISLDPSRGEIAYEWMDGLHRMLLPAKGATQRVEQLGRLLARVHAESRSASTDLVDSAPPYMPEHLGLPAGKAEVLRHHFPTVFFHGDCWHGNVFWRDDGSFVMLDPIPNPWLFDRSRWRACAAIDLAMMHMSLFLCHSALAHLLRGMGAYHQLAESLLSGYSAAGGASGADWKRPLLSLSRIIAKRHVSAYRQRLARPVATLKTGIGRRVVGKLDGEIAWNR